MKKKLLSDYRGLFKKELGLEERPLCDVYLNLGLHFTNNGPLIVRDGVIILIPKKARNTLLLQSIICIKIAQTMQCDSTGLDVTGPWEGDCH